MNEELLHYAWQQKKFQLTHLHTTDGEPIEILDIGLRNTNAGADFFNAKVKIGALLWAGDVEIHLKSSDWYAHNHHTNPSYNNVILHVVQCCDSDTYDSNHRKIPQLELQIPDHIVDNYHELKTTARQIACLPHLTKIDSFTIRLWQETLLLERLMQKATLIAQHMEQSNNDWETTLYHILARSFGFGKNNDAFMLLAQSLPLTYIRKHSDNLLQIEAMLFGQASLLPAETTSDPYIEALRKEYNFLQHKFSLTPLQPGLWKMLRLRPCNFPHVRIAQFAALLHRSTNIFATIIEPHSIKELQKLFVVTPSHYWDNHYSFNKESNDNYRKTLTTNSANSLLINVVAPFLFAYEKHQAQTQFHDRALELLHALAPEQNSIIKSYSSYGFAANNAADTQAIIQLKSNYCDHRDCLRCRIGHKVLTVAPNGIV